MRPAITLLRLDGGGWKRVEKAPVWLGFQAVYIVHGSVYFAWACRRASALGFCCESLITPRRRRGLRVCGMPA